MKTISLVKSKIVSIEADEEFEANLEQTAQLLKRYKFGSNLSLPYFCKLENNIIYYRARLQITLQNDSSHVKHFENNEEMFEFVKDNLSDLQTISI